jgi:cytochrome c-type biogenesis protein CcmE
MSKGAQIAVGAVLVALLLGWYGYTNLQGEGAFQYYQSLNEFLTESRNLEGQSLRVHGYVANDSIHRDLKAKKVRFVVQNDPPHAGISNERTLEVLFLGLETPDMFKDGAEVVIEGRIQNQPSSTLFLADNLMAKCPSKFEAQAQEGGPDAGVPL